MFLYWRTVRFQETDAAGVMYFANGLAICHEAYEASLSASGIDLKAFFKGTLGAVPIVHASVDFLRPISVGDRLEIHLTPEQTRPTEFEIQYQIFLEAVPDKPVIKALTRHVCIDGQARDRQALAPMVITWLSQWSAPSAAISGD
jgi:1,4-dihydroxy-2-naphthoyl-CoA hydrolase